MSNGDHWVTAGGHVVKQRGRDVGGKARCYNVKTGGYRGLLWIRNLRPATRFEIKASGTSGITMIRRLGVSSTQPK